MNGIRGKAPLRDLLSLISLSMGSLDQCIRPSVSTLLFKKSNSSLMRASEYFT